MFKRTIFLSLFATASLFSAASAQGTTYTLHMKDGGVRRLNTAERRADARKPLSCLRS